jgi:putative membrane protein
MMTGFYGSFRWKKLQSNKEDFMIHTNENGNVLKGLAAGLIGGLAATWVMTQFQNGVSQIAEATSDKENKKKKEESGENATVKTAKAISENVFDHKLKKSEKEQAGNAVHYGFGTTVGAVYGMTAEFVPITTIGSGLPFGAVLFLGADEVAVPAFGLSESPTEIPLSTHAYGFASHLVYGMTAEFVRRTVRKVI